MAQIGDRLPEGKLAGLGLADELCLPACGRFGSGRGDGGAGGEYPGC